MTIREVSTGKWSSVTVVKNADSDNLGHNGLEFRHVSTCVSTCECEIIPY